MAENNVGKLLQSERNGYVLSYKGYLYNYHSDNRAGTRRYWICRRRPQCTTRATTEKPSGRSDTVQVYKAVDHPSHVPSPDEAKAIDIYSQLKRKAVDQPEAPPAQILRQELPRVPSAVLPYLPERETMKRTFNKRRSVNFPRNPKSISDIGELPEEYKKTLDGKEFLLYDSWNESDDSDDDEPPEKRILVFATKNGLRKLARSPTLWLDGTFETAPDIFTQIFTVHGSHGNEAFPFVFALLPDKEQQSYATVLQAITDKCEELRINPPNPATVISDFEMGIINAARARFPEAELRLCLFHLRQSAWRKIQEEGLQVAYRDPEDETIRNGFKEIVGLAFVPLADVERACEEVLENLPDRMLDFGDYFERTYVVGRRARGRRRGTPPRYLPAWWNQYRAAREREPRTNNITEAWQNRFQTVVGKSHPSLYKLIAEFKKEEADVQTMIRELDAGRKIRQQQKAMYARINERLHTLSGRYQEFKADNRLLDYVCGCGHNVAL